MASGIAFDEKDMAAFEPTSKVGLLATVSPAGLPHLSLITSLEAKTPTRMIWGQFTEGLSKVHVRTDPKTAFLVMTLDRRLWRGKARYSHAVTEGEDHVRMNNKPMFRYNAYFGIHTVHYMDVVEARGPESLPLPAIVLSSLVTAAAKGLARTGSPDRILSPWAQGLIGRIGVPKFLAYVGDDGFPVIVPVLQCLAADSRRLVFSPLAYRAELLAVPAGREVAVFGMSMEMEDVLARGTYRGRKRFGPVRLGVIDLNYVYNSMPPNHGQVYPPVPLSPVTEF
jgi:hypothetical protein